MHSINHQKILSALIGLVGAIGNNGKTENTDEIVRKALFTEDAEEAVALIHKEKYTISPDCATCQHPCGNTSDYSLAKFAQTPEEVLSLKGEVYKEIKLLISRLNADTQLPEVVYRAISYMGYDLQPDSYRELIAEMQKL